MPRPRLHGCATDGEKRTLSCVWLSDPFNLGLGLVEGQAVPQLCCEKCLRALPAAAAIVGKDIATGIPVVQKLKHLEVRASLRVVVRVIPSLDEITLAVEENP